LEGCIVKIQKSGRVLAGPRVNPARRPQIQALRQMIGNSDAQSGRIEIYKTRILAAYGAYETSKAVVLPGLIADGVVFFVSQEKLADLGMHCSLVELGKLPANEEGKRTPENAAKLRVIQTQAQTFFHRELSQDLGREFACWHTYAFGFAIEGERFQGAAIVQIKPQGVLPDLPKLLSYCAQRFVMENILPRSQKHFDFAKQVLGSFIEGELPQAEDPIFRPCFGGLEVSVRIPPRGILADFARRPVMSPADELAIQTAWLEFIEPIWDHHSKLVERLHFPDLAKVFSCQTLQILVTPNAAGEPIFSGLIVSIAVASLYAMLAANPREGMEVSVQRVMEFSENSIVRYLQKRPNLQVYHPPFVASAKKILGKLMESVLPGHSLAVEQFRNGGYEFFCYLSAAKFLPKDTRREFQKQAEIKATILPLLDHFRLVVQRVRKELAGATGDVRHAVDFAVQFGPCKKAGVPENRLDGLVLGLRFEAADPGVSPQALAQLDQQRSQVLVRAIIDYHNSHAAVLPEFMALPD